jgi:hypothetical protein
MVLAMPAFAAAQRGGGGGAHAAAPVAAGHSGAFMSRGGPAPARVAVRGGAQGGARVSGPIAGSRASGRMNRGGNRTNSGFNGAGFNRTDNGTSSQNVPGLGFDYPHLAAVNGNRRGHGGRFDGAPFGFGGFLLDSPGIIEVPSGDSGVAEDQIANDPPIDDGTDVAAAPRRSRAPREPVQPEAAPAPPEDVEQYVLVRQDGGVVFAVAYTWQNGTLRYITPDGLRHTIKRDALDMNATQQFNEQRGLNFQAPA